MVVRDEVGNLNKTLSLWKRYVGQYVIGIDTASTDGDAMEKVIKTHLGEFPGRIVRTSAGNGFQHAWNQVIQTGLREFPSSSFGVMADADFAPLQMQLNLDRLDKIQCNLLSLDVLSQDGYIKPTKRFYRNIPEVHAVRHADPELQAPKFRGSDEALCHSGFRVIESPGFLQTKDGRSEFMTMLLDKDLFDSPVDSKTLFLLGDEYYTQAMRRESLDDDVLGLLRESMQFFSQVAHLPDADRDYKYDSLIRMAWINQRGFNKWDESKDIYLGAINTDPERLDGYFYAAQLYRHDKKFDEAFDVLVQGKDLTLPLRQVPQWSLIYRCFAAVELGRSAVNIKSNVLDRIETAFSWLNSSDCSFDEKAEKDKNQVLTMLLSRSEFEVRPRFMTLFQFYQYLQRRSDLLQLLSSDFAVQFDDINSNIASAIKQYGKVANDVSCSDFRSVKAEFLGLIDDERDSIKAELKKGGKESYFNELTQLASTMRSHCQDARF